MPIQNKQPTSINSIPYKGNELLPVEAVFEKRNDQKEAL
jgi:hypothetical protein